MQIIFHNKHRSITSLVNALRFLLMPLGQLILAKLVIGEDSHALWGQVIAVTIYIQLGSIISNWGNRDYALRQMVARPNAVKEVWWSSFAPRLALLAVAVIVLIISFPQYMLPICIWLISVYIIQSFDCLVLYTEKTRLLGWVELILFLVFLVLALMVRPYLVNAANILWLMAITQILKAMIYLIYFRNFVEINRIKSPVRHLKNMLPFLLISLTGLLFSRVDLYVANYFLSDDVLGKYQLFIGLFIQLQALSGFMYMPIMQSVFKLKGSSALKLSRRSVVFGSALLAVAVPVLHYVLQEIYLINFSIWAYILGSIFALSMFFIAPLIAFLIGRKKEGLVAQLSAFGIAINLILSCLLVMKWLELGLIFATCVVQITMAIIYYIKVRHYISNTHNRAIG